MDIIKPAAIELPTVTVEPEHYGESHNAGYPAIYEFVTSLSGGELRAFQAHLAEWRGCFPMVRQGVDTSPISVAYGRCPFEATPEGRRYLIVLIAEKPPRERPRGLSQDEINIENLIREQIRTRRRLDWLIEQLSSVDVITGSMLSSQPSSEVSRGEELEYMQVPSLDLFLPLVDEVP